VPTLVNQMNHCMVLSGQTCALLLTHRVLCMLCMLCVLACCAGNNFSSELAQLLVGRDIPAHITGGARLGGTHRLFACVALVGGLRVVVGGLLGLLDVWHACFTGWRVGWLPGLPSFCAVETPTEQSELFRHATACARGVKSRLTPAGHTGPGLDCIWSRSGQGALQAPSCSTPHMPCCAFLASVRLACAMWRMHMRVPRRACACSVPVCQCGLGCLFLIRRFATSNTQQHEWGA